MARLLILAASARALAQAARRASLRVQVADAFADEDTASCAERLRHIPELLGDSEERLLEAVEPLLAGRPRLIVGGGLEAWPRLLCELERRGELLGTSSELWLNVNKSLFNSHLRGKYNVHAGFGRQPSAGSWLVKRISGSGGCGVRPWRPGEALLPGEYLQKRLPGRPCSVVFLADGRRAVLLGSNTLYSLAPERGDFRYAGAINRARLPAALERALPERLDALVRETGLRGLCGLDFFAAPDGGLRLLEINPRPTATCELHERPSGLLRWHILACRGRLPRRLPALPLRRPVAGRSVCYAGKGFVLPADWRWPSWTADRPRPGARIAAGQPVCSLYARAASETRVKSLLAARQAWLTMALRRHGLPPLTLPVIHQEK